MNGLKKNNKKKIDPKARKNSKNQSEIAACERKIISEKAIFVKTPFPRSTLKLELKIHATKPLAFCSTSSFVVTKITTPV